MKGKVFEEIENFKKEEIISKNLSKEVDKRSFTILELQGQVLSREQELLKAKQRFTDQEVNVEKTKCDLNTILDSLSTAEHCISQNKIKKKEMLNMINMELNYLNDLVALNENLKIKKSEIHIKHNNIEKEISKVQQKIKTNKISLYVRDCSSIT